MNTQKKWYRQIVGPASERSVAAATGIEQSTLNRQLKATLSPENVVAIARAYDASPLDGLVATGLLRRDEVGTAGILDALRAASDEQLVEEVSRRLHDAAPVAKVYSLPMSEADGMFEAANNPGYHAADEQGDRD